MRRSKLAGLASYGYCAAHSRWYWGLKLYLLVHGRGMPVAWSLASPRIGERDVAQELLDRALEEGTLQAGAIVLADKGPVGKDIERFTTDELQVLVARPDRKDQKRKFGSLGGSRQWIESVYDTLKDQLGLEHHDARTPEGRLRPHCPAAARSA